MQEWMNERLKSSYFADWDVPCHTHTHTLHTESDARSQWRWMERYNFLLILRLAYIWVSSLFPYSFFFLSRFYLWQNVIFYHFDELLKVFVFLDYDYDWANASSSLESITGKLEHTYTYAYHVYWLESIQYLFFMRFVFCVSSSILFASRIGNLAIGMSIFYAVTVWSIIDL